MCTITMLLLLKFNNTNALAFVLSEPLSGTKDPKKYEKMAITRF